MNDLFSRHDFLNLSGLSLAALWMRPLLDAIRVVEPTEPIGLARVTAEMIFIRDIPSFSGNRIGQLTRDTLVWLREEIISPDGPEHNPRWFRIDAGYIHSGYLQWMDKPCFTDPLTSLPEGGVLGQVTVPYAQSYQYTSADGWQKLYRLYYQSVHCITGIEQRDDGVILYRITDHLINVDYHVPAIFLRPIFPEDYAPLSPEVSPNDKRISISIAQQSLTAYEGDIPVFSTLVASGKHQEEVPEGELPTDTPIGSFRIQTKIPSRHMGEGDLTDEVMAYELPGVPWTMIFHETGVALHGAFWHNNFGIRMSHGCVNLPNEAALWLFRWTTPEYPRYNSTDWYVRESGTLVQVFED